MAKLENYEQELQGARKEYHVIDFEESPEEDIIAAAHVGNLTLVEHLIKDGANVNIRNDCDDTALMEAVVWGHHTIIDMLLKNGANVN